MTLETAFNIVLQDARAHRLEHPAHLPRKRAEAWEIVSEYALNEASNRPEWREEE